MLRRVGGSRRALDAAVSAAGVDPGGRRPVRERAVEAGARLISERGLVAATLEAVAQSAGCDLFARPDGPMGRIFMRYFPRVLDSVGGWLAEEVAAGRIRPLPVPLLIQQLIGPLVVHLLFRLTMTRGVGWEPPSVQASCEVFADAFLRAVAVGRGEHPVGSSPSPPAPLDTGAGLAHHTWRRWT